MARLPFLRSYEDWKHCITVLCGIPLTSAYVEQRITALNNPKEYTTQRFIETWGDAHLEQVKSWFARAHDELSNGKVLS